MSEETVKKEVSARQPDGKWRVVTNAPKLGKTAITLLDLHDDNLASMTAWTSEKQVLDSAIDSWIISAQSRIRNRLAAGKTNEEIQTEMDSFKPDVIVRGTADPIAATLNKFGNMSAEDQALFMKELKARLAKKAG